jgi:hypothetical protein
MDQFRHENLTPEMVDKATKAMMGMGLNPRDILTNPERFNSYPAEVRSKFFQKIGGSPVIQVAGVGGPPDPILDIFEDRIRSAPKQEAAPTDISEIFKSRINELETQQAQQAVTKEALRQAEVPTMGPTGVVRDQPAQRKARSLKDYLVGGGEAALTTLTGAVAAPIAAYEELGARVLGSKQPPGKVFAERMGAMTFAPRTEVGKEAVAGLGEAFEATKLPPVLTPEFMALGQARRGAIVSPKAVPGYVAQTGEEVAAAARAVPGDIKAAAAPALEGIGMRSVGAAGRADQTRFEAAVNMLPEAYRAQAREMGWKKSNPAVIEAHGQALNLPVPIQLTAGQATGDIVALSREYNQRGKNTEFAYRFNEQNRGLVENLDRLRDMAAPKVFDSRPLATGQTLTKAYRELDRRLNDNIDAKFAALRDAAGGDFPIDVNKLAVNVEAALKKDVLRSVAEGMSDYKDIVDLAKSGNIDFDTYLNLRRNLGDTARTSTDGKQRRAAGVMLEQLEKLPLRDDVAYLKGLADEARNAARERFDMLNPKKDSYDPAFKAVVNKQIADERFVDSYLFGARGTKNQLEKMIQNLGEDQKQVIAAAMIERIRDRAVAANGDFNPTAYAKEFKALEPRLLDVFSGETVQQMRDVGDVAKRVKSSPSGSFFNRSGTLVGALAEQAAGVAEQGVNVTVMSKTGIPVPVATLGREKLSARKAAKETERTLEPLAGAKTKLKDIGKD